MKGTKVEIKSLTFVGDVIFVVDQHNASHVVSVVEYRRLLLEHDFHVVHQLIHRSRRAGATAD